VGLLSSSRNDCLRHQELRKGLRNWKLAAEAGERPEMNPGKTRSARLQVSESFRGRGMMDFGSRMDKSDVRLEEE